MVIHDNGLIMNYSQSILLGDARIMFITNGRGLKINSLFQLKYNFGACISIGSQSGPAVRSGGWVCNKPWPRTPVYLRRFPPKDVRPQHVLEASTQLYVTSLLFLTWTKWGAFCSLNANLTRKTLTFFGCKVKPSRFLGKKSASFLWQTMQIR